jgi:hypothetical protein
MNQFIHLLKISFKTTISLWLSLFIMHQIMNFKLISLTIKQWTHFEFIFGINQFVILFFKNKLPYLSFEGMIVFEIVIRLILFLFVNLFLYWRIVSIIFWKITKILLTKKNYLLSSYGIIIMNMKWLKIKAKNEFSDSE